MRTAPFALIIGELLAFPQAGGVILAFTAVAISGVCTNACPRTQSLQDPPIDGMNN